MGCQLCLKLGHFGAEDILAVIQHGFDARVDIGAQPGLLCGKVQDRDHAAGSSMVTWPFRSQ